MSAAAASKTTKVIPAGAQRISSNGDEEFRKMGGEELAATAILGSKDRAERARQELAKRAWNKIVKKRSR